LSSSSLSPLPISLHHRMRCTLTSRCAWWKGHVSA
jgi:hypothetical protein